MTARVFCGAVRIDAPRADERLLGYGDGLFETMRVHAGGVPWWDAHWARLARGAQVLRLALPAQALVLQQAGELFDDGCEGVLKLLVGRGGGGRGYAPVPDAPPTWLVSRHPLPPPPTRDLHLRWCDLRLAAQPGLAGIKHCNRLEQVLARAEWNDPAAVDRDADEGLLCGADGDVVGATAANIFLLREGGWITPGLDQCGVEGVCRGQLLAPLRARQMRVSADDVETADAIFLCNAVRGILAVARIGARTLHPHPAVADARRALARIHPGFAIPAETQ